MLVKKSNKKFFSNLIDRKYSTGGRKSSSARVWIAPGSGKFLVNKRELNCYFPLESDRNVLLIPFSVCNLDPAKFDVYTTVSGGGVSGQKNAIKHGLSLAISKFSPENEILIKKSDLNTRDSREVESKKYGRKGARGGFQFSKR